MTKTLHYMVLKTFLPIFLIAIMFFILILQLVDVFGNLWRYMNQDIPFASIARVAALYTPKCVSYSLSPSLLFAIAFTLGTFYANNELIAVFGSGVSLLRLVFPLILLSLALSFGGFMFEENVVIETFAEKNELSRNLLNQRTSYSNTKITVLSANGRIIYHADYYNDNAQSLSGLILYERDDSGSFVRRIDSEWGAWKDGVWQLNRARIFEWDRETGFIRETYSERFVDERFDENPSTFRKMVKNIEELKMGDAELFISSLRRAGLPFREQLTEYYRRFSFAFTPLIVAIISCAVGGRFKKNILLMSLLVSLVVSVGYYVIQMLAVLFAKLGYITPLTGAWSAFVIFMLAGIVLFRNARS